MSLRYNIRNINTSVSLITLKNAQVFEVRYFGLFFISIWKSRKSDESQIYIIIHRVCVCLCLVPPSYDFKDFPDFSKISDFPVFFPLFFTLRASWLLRE